MKWCPRAEEHGWAGAVNALAPFVAQHSHPGGSTGDNKRRSRHAPDSVPRIVITHARALQVIQFTGMTPDISLELSNPKYSSVSGMSKPGAMTLQQPYRKAQGVAHSNDHFGGGVQHDD